jgi:ribA/ribD-fused uncharacterized protein
MTDYKERRTNTHVYFVSGPFSQWYSSPFTADIWGDRGRNCIQNEKFVSCEQYMMAGKALMFNDEEIYQAIMRTTNPREHKALGRQVRGFDPAIWEAPDGARDIVYRGNMAKFSSSEFFSNYIRGTENLHIVEGAIYDAVWGVKLAWDNPAIENPLNWCGKNWLGETLMRVRGDL